MYPWNLKETVGVTLSDPSFTEWHVRFITDPFKPCQRNNVEKSSFFNPKSFFRENNHIASRINQGIIPLFLLRIEHK